MSSIRRIQLRPALNLALAEILTSPVWELAHFYLFNYLLTLLGFILAVAFDFLCRIINALWRLFIVYCIIHLLRYLFSSHHSKKDEEEETDD